MNHSTPGLPVHHQLPEFTQTHVHRVSDAIQPSHPLSSPSPPAPNPSQSLENCKLIQGDITIYTLIRMAKTQKADDPKCFVRLWNNRNAYSLLVGMQNFARQLLPKLKTLLPYIVGWIFPLPPNYVEVLTPSTCDVTLFGNRGFADVDKLRWDHTELGASQVPLVVKNQPANAGDIRNAGSIPESGRGSGNTFQYSCLENPMDRGAWGAMVHTVAKRYN